MLQLVGRGVPFLRCQPFATKRCLSIKNGDPIAYDSNFKIPSKDFAYPLETLNAHPHDKLMVFDEPTHTYMFDNTLLRQSVTEVVSNYFGKFDPDASVKSMMNGSNWPRPQYVDEKGIPHTAEQIKQGWALYGEIARNQGTWMHWNIEKHINGLEVKTTIPEFKQFLQFEQEVLKKNGIRPYRTEWRVAAPDLNLGGSIDFVGQQADGSFVLIDWKRSKNLAGDMYKAYGKYGRKPLQHLPECDGTKYSLQLNIYRYVLARYYDVHVSRMLLGCFHPAQRAYFKAEVAPMDKEVDVIVQELTAQNKVHAK